MSDALPKVSASPAVFSFDALDTKTAAEVGFEVDILNALGDSSGMFITVLGSDSSTYSKLREKFDRQRMKKMSKGGRNALDLVYDDAKQVDFELAAESTIAWRHKTQTMPFAVTDKDQLVAFYKSYPLAYDQVRVAMLDRANFTKERASS